jgi:hypothetical protein
VQKILFNTGSPKTIVYSFKPFTGKLSGYVAETQCCQGFCEIKTTGRSVSKKMILLKSLPDKASVIFQKK